MDPVKEKLNLLKKLANEKKASTNTNSTNQSRLQDENEQQPNNDNSKDLDNNNKNNNNNTNKSRSKVKHNDNKVRKHLEKIHKLDENGNGDEGSGVGGGGSAIAAAAEQYFDLEEEKNKDIKNTQQTTDDNSVSIETPLQHSPDSLIVYEDNNTNNNSYSLNNTTTNLTTTKADLTDSTLEDNSISMDIKEFNNNNNNNNNNSSKLAPVDVKINSGLAQNAYRNFTVPNQQQNQQHQVPDQSTFKYINRIKNLYDRERASSTESISQKPQMAQLKKSFPAQQPDDSTLASDHDETASILSTSTNNQPSQQQQQRSNKYIKHLCDTFNNTSAASGGRSDSIDTSLLKQQQRSMYGQPENSQIDRIKEKFSRMNQNAAYNPHKRHSIMYHQPNVLTSSKNLFDKGNKLTLSNSNLSKSLKSLKSDDITNINKFNFLHQFLDLNLNEAVENDDVDLADLVAKNEQRLANSTNSSTRPLYKYQKSKTCDLANFIFTTNTNDAENNKQQPQQQQSTPKDHEKETVPSKPLKLLTKDDSDYDSLFDRYALDTKYQAENAIIRSSLSNPANSTGKHNKNQTSSEKQANEPTSPPPQSTAAPVQAKSLPGPINAASNNEFKKSSPPNERVIPSIITTEVKSPTPTTPTTPGAVAPTTKRTKSILKSPSTISEKSIHFDDRIDVIQIDRLSNNSSPAVSDINAGCNPDVFKQQQQQQPAPVATSQTEKTKTMLLAQPQPQQQQQPQSTPTMGSRFSSEIEAIKRMLLEPMEKKKSFINFPDSTTTPSSSSSKRDSMLRPRNERVFIKSPTPMRELPNFPNTSAFNDHYYENDERLLSNNSNSTNTDNKNRNRFAKKKLANNANNNSNNSNNLRSQSVDLAKINDKLVLPATGGNVQSIAQANFEPARRHAKLMSPVPNLRPNLTRQNALAKSYTKSLGENLDRVVRLDYVEPAQFELQQQQLPTQSVKKPPKSNRAIKFNRPARKSNKHHNHHRRKRTFERSSSLTSSSSSSSSDTSSEEMVNHSDSFLSSSPSTSLEDLAKLNDENGPYLTLSTTAGTAAQVPSTNAPNNLLNLPRSSKKQMPSIPATFDKVKLQQQQKRLNKHNFYSSDDSVCGIPKSTTKLASSTRLCSSGKSFHKSMDELGYNREFGLSSNLNHNHTSNKDDYDKYPSFDDQDSHLSRNPASLKISNKQLLQQQQADLYLNNLNGLNHHHQQQQQQLKQPTSFISNLPLQETSNTIDQQLQLQLQQPNNYYQQQAMYNIDGSINTNYNPNGNNNNVYRKTSTDSMKSGNEHHHFPHRNGENQTPTPPPGNGYKKPLPSYSQLVLSNPNAFPFFQQQHNQHNQVNLVRSPPPMGVNRGPPLANANYMKYDNNTPDNIVSSPTNFLNNNNNIYSVNDPSSNKRMTQAIYQQTHGQPPHHQHHHHGPNFQQSRSRSLDANMYYDANHYNNEEDYNTSIMPQQSVAIQEKLKMFEQQQLLQQQQQLQQHPQSPPPNYLNDARKKPVQSHQQPQSQVGQYDQQFINMYNMKKSSFETNNKENSPYSTAAPVSKHSLVGGSMITSVNGNNTNNNSSTATNVHANSNPAVNQRYNFQPPTHHHIHNHQYQHHHQSSPINLNTSNVSRRPNSNNLNSSSNVDFLNEENAATTTTQQTGKFYPNNQQLAGTKSTYHIMSPPPNTQKYVLTSAANENNNNNNNTSSTSHSQRISPSKSFNYNKFSQFAAQPTANAQLSTNTNMIKSTTSLNGNLPRPNYINPNLAAATAAAAAAIAAVQQQQQPADYTNGASKSKIMKSDNSPNEMSAYPEPKDYHMSMSSQNNNSEHIKHPKAQLPPSYLDYQREKSTEKQPNQAKTPLALVNTNNNTSLIDNSDLTRLASAKRATIYEQFSHSSPPPPTPPPQAVTSTHLLAQPLVDHSSRMSLFSKSTISPSKISLTTNTNVNAALTPATFNTTIDDVEMLSSSPSSTSSLKENNNNGKTAHIINNKPTTNKSPKSVTNPNSKPLTENNNNSEPSKLSISEKMKLFSGNSSTPTTNTTTTTTSTNITNPVINTNNTNLSSNTRPKSSINTSSTTSTPTPPTAINNKSNRFQTQPVSSTDLDYANKLNQNINKNLLLNSDYNNNLAAAAAVAAVNPANNHHNLNTKSFSSIDNTSNNNNNSNSQNIIKLFDNHHHNNNKVESMENAISSKTITFMKKQQQQQDSILNDNQSESPSLVKAPKIGIDTTTASNSNSNKMSAAATNVGESVNLVDATAGKAVEREPKRYKYKSKTDLIQSNELDSAAAARNSDEPKSETNENSRPVEPNPASTTNNGVSNLEVGLTIQERMAALKKIGEEDWKRRTNANPITTNKTESSVNNNNNNNNHSNSSNSSNTNDSIQTNIVKQQKEQIQQQLKQMITTSKSKINTSDLSAAAAAIACQKQRNVLSALDDNNNQHDNLDLNLNKANSPSNESLNDQDLFVNKKALIGKRVMFHKPSDLSMAHNSFTFTTPASGLSTNTTAAATTQNTVSTAAKPKHQHNRVLKHSASSDTDTMFTRNANVIAAAEKSLSNMLQRTGAGAGTGSGGAVKNEKVELFSTDSEMDSFFKENETILNSNLLSSSSTTTARDKTDENTMNEDLDDVEFDRIVSEANRLTQRTRAKPSRKAKSKGNHLKNLQNRIEIKNEYEQTRTTPLADLSSSASFKYKSSASPSKIN